MIWVMLLMILRIEILIIQTLPNDKLSSEIYIIDVQEYN